ncbi:MAG: hypothetical protein KIG36_00230 [Eubacteriales bacterium]|nr:hypothetical protein [Eubacteriales bacterium]
MNEETIFIGRFDCEPADLCGFDRFKAGPMTFNVRRYHLRGIGNLAFMDAQGMLGLMKMRTMFLTPLERDAALLTFDRIHAGGADTLLIEPFDTVLARGDDFSTAMRQLDELCAGAKDLPPYVTKPNWTDSLHLSPYVGKKGKHKRHGEAFDRLTEAYFGLYCDWLDSAAPCDKAAKTARVKAYVDGLLEHGGPATDMLVKSLGQPRTETLFRQVLFGIE